MNERIMDVIQTDLEFALTTPAMTGVTSLTSILFVHLVNYIAFEFSLKSNWQ